MGQAWQSWFVLTGGVVVATMGVPHLTGRKTAGFRRPRVGGWACSTGGAGLVFGALLDLVGVGGFALLVPFCLVFLALVLLLCGGPVARSSRHRA
ncbi:hypothetical protein [Streptomyces sp. NBC_00102]|uniref:hypothetical protein n=1 Tax=Streptomyces sp. NBC_00102 TaxID=2975652 RepID=UPI00224EB509|nr:hypothetical protein [Streptomyces sp. NBC_00102]MCX5398849.1 hypothetical protein [Streptomyces sp. NBC_00102]